ncbi:MAG: serine/threonine-protein kinase [Byssovorax sp.]
MPPMISGALVAGQVFHGRYAIVRRLNAGGMGAVYECIHLKTRKRRALKVMLPEIVASASMRERFELEARVTADIESEHIVETFDAGVDEETGYPFLVMELLRGEELSTLLDRRGALPFDEVVLLLFQAALALDRTHAAGIVHRDLKPDNFFVTSRDDGSPRLKILDFGVAKVVADGTRALQQTAAIGTPLYMSPEQFRGDGAIGPRADIYALGHIAYALLTGRPYWHDEELSNPAIFAFVVLVMTGPQERPTERAARRGVDLPGGFDAWFAKAIAMKPRDRFDRASTLVTELAAVLGVVPPRLSLASWPSRTSSSPDVLSVQTRLDTSSMVPTRHVSRIRRGAVTAVDRVPAGSLEREETSTASDLGLGSTSPLPPPRPSRLRMVLLVPVSALVIWIGVMVLLRALKEGATVGPPASTVSAVSAAIDSGAAMVPAPTASSVPSAAPSSVASAARSGSTVNIDSLPSVVSSSRRAPESPPSPPKAPRPSGPKEEPYDDCSPPYTVDRLGHVYPKPHCN